MTFKVWNEDSVKDTDDNITYLRLFDRGYISGIALAATDKNGEILDDGTILAVLPTLKYILLLDDLNDDIPLKTDAEGYPLIVTIKQFKQLNEESRRNIVSQFLHSKMKDILGSDDEDNKDSNKCNH